MNKLSYVATVQDYAFRDTCFCRSLAPAADITNTTNDAIFLNSLLLLGCFSQKTLLSFIMFGCLVFSFLSSSYPFQGFKIQRSTQPFFLLRPVVYVDAVPVVVAGQGGLRNVWGSHVGFAGGFAPFCLYFSLLSSAPFLLSCFFTPFASSFSALAETPQLPLSLGQETWYCGRKLQK